ncbi:MAG: type II toxin-antitoxin system VapC family toxin [Candidatus Sericytochromatia bacterium]
MKAILADSGPLYAAFDPGDQYHMRSQDEIQQLNQQGFRVQVAYSTLSEVYSLVMYRFSAAEALGFLSQLSQTIAFIPVQPEDYQAAIELLRRYPDQKISLFDAVLCNVSQCLRFPVWTYDYHFDVMQGQVWRN